MRCFEPVESLELCSFFFFPAFEFLYAPKEKMEIIGGSFRNSEHLIFLLVGFSFFIYKYNDIILPLELLLNYLE